MFKHTWKKYLPVITILIKRSATGEQTLSMNHTDFERAAGGKKTKFTFSNLTLDNGRAEYQSKYPAVASDFILSLQEDEQTKKLLQKRQFEFSMSEFRLTIRNKTVNSEPPAEEKTEAGIEGSATETTS